MNKKAILVENKTAVIILAGLFLILMFGIIGYNLGWFKSLASFIPGIEIPIRKGVNVNIFGYNVATDKLEYYDGTKWIAINGWGENAVGSIKFSGGDWYRAFYKFYYDRDFLEPLFRVGTGTAKVSMLVKEANSYLKDKRGYAVVEYDFMEPLKTLAINRFFFIDLDNRMYEESVDYEQTIVGHIKRTSEGASRYYLDMDYLELVQNSECTFIGSDTKALLSLLNKKALPKSFLAFSLSSNSVSTLDLEMHEALEGLSIKLIKEELPTLGSKIKRIYRIYSYDKPLEIYLDLTMNSNGFVEDELFINAPCRGYYTFNELTSLTSNQQEIRKKVIDWRNSIFRGGTKPQALTLSYRDAKGNLQTRSFCVGLINEHMVVYLDNAVSAGSLCA